MSTVEPLAGLLEQTTPLKVLIVDDSPEDAAQYVHLLSGAAECHHAQVGEIGARLLQEISPDCVLLDFDLPDMTGLEFLEQYRPQVPVLVITGSAEHTVAAGVLQAGARRLLNKRELNTDLLLTQINESLSEDALTRELTLQRHRMQAVLDSTGHGMLFARHDGDWQVEYLNPAARSLLGVEVGVLDSGGLGDTQARALSELLGRTGRLERPQRITLPVQDRVLDLDCTPRADGFIVTVRDVTSEQRRARLDQARHEVLQRFVESRPLPDVLSGLQDMVGALLPGHSGRVLAGHLLLTWPHLSALGVSTATYPHVTGRGARRAHVATAGSGCWALPVVATDDHELLGALLIDCPYPDESVPAQLGDVVNLITLLLMQARDQTRLQQQAWRDPLTGLPNRAVFMDQLQRELSAAHRHGSMLAVGVLDLDGFKAVNDTYGHASGDALLVEMGRRLRLTFRSSDVVSRVGGDEFMLLLPDWTDPEDLESDLRRRLQQVVARPFRVGEAELQVRASLGVAVAPHHGRTVDRVLHLADRAMYRAKRAGGGVRLSMEDGA